MSANSLVNGWQNVKLGDIIELKYGKSLPAKDRDNTGYPVYGSNGVVGEHSQPLVKTQGLIVGRKGSYGEVTLSKQPFSPIDTTYYVDDFYGQPIDYWYYLLKFLPLTELNRSTAIPGLNRDDAYSLEIQLPSLAEQQVIAQKLTTLLTQVESIKARLERIPEILKQFRQSVLTAAVSGKLTGECEIHDWQSMTIGEVAEVRTGKTPSRTESKYWDNGIIPWLTSSVTGSEYCFNADEFISEIASKECNLKPFPVGTLLLAMYGEGKTRGQVTELKLEATCNQACAAIIPNNEIALTSYVKLKLQENYEVIRLAASGGNQPNLNLNKVREIGIQIPTIEVQAKIVHKVDALLTISENINQQVLSALDRVNNLTQSILAKAFLGELTADWREANLELISGENSAEVLLGRIKAERELAKPATKRGRGKL